MARSPLPGSERDPLAGATSVGAADPDERLEVSVLLRRRGAETSCLRDDGAHFTRPEFERRFGAAHADIGAIRKFADWHGLAVVQEHAGRRTMVLSGTVAQFDAAFDVELQRFEYPGGSYRGRVGSIQLPDELLGRVEAVLGLDNRPAARPRFRACAGRGISFTPVQLAALYDFPAGSGLGTCVGIIELGGGERPADLTEYFAGLRVGPVPAIVAVSVDHGRNQATGDPNGPDSEVMLDIEVVGAIAPQARIAVYFAPNTDAGFLDAITTAIHDTTNRPSVISISWGSPESCWTAQSLRMFDAAFQAAAAMGITIVVASGNDGSGCGADHVDFPASSPYALACGGTRLLMAGGGISSEAVWNSGVQGGSSGGGVSRVFARPKWQDGLTAARTQGGSERLAMRGVPDVCGDADPLTGYDVRIGGTDTVIGGTSAVAPLWAGLIARINAKRGSSVGLIAPRLYATPNALNDVREGNNGSFAASAGWDACTGLGSPRGSAVAALFGGFGS